MWHKMNFTKKIAKVLIGVVWCTSFYQILAQTISTTVTEDGKCKPLTNWYTFTLLTIRTYNAGHLQWFKYYTHNNFMETI